MAWSAPINIVRITNGTLVQLTASTDRFLSYDYSAETHNGTFKPSSIRVTPKFGGDVGFGKWEISTDGTTWTDADNVDGVTSTTTALTIKPACSRFTDENSVVVIRCMGDDGIHFDTVTITREVSSIRVYEKQYTDFIQTKNLISLIASDEQIRQFSDGNTFYSQFAELEIDAGKIRGEVKSDISKESASLKNQIGSVELKTNGLATRIETVEEKQEDDEKILSEHSTTLAQLDDKFVLSVNFTEDKLLTNGTKTELQNIQNNFTFGTDGLLIGRSDSEIQSLFSNDELSFMTGYGTDGETKLAWISSDGFGTNKLSIGNATGTGLRWNITVSEDGSHLKFTRRL